MNRGIGIGLGFPAQLLGSILIVPLSLLGQGSPAVTPTTPQGQWVEEAGRVLSPKNMPQIADALGVKCTHCHLAKLEDGKPDYKPSSPMKETAKYMKIHFVDGLVTVDNQPLTCSSCHAGKARFLPHQLPPDAPKSAVQGDRLETMKRMNGIAKALGVRCDFCHAKGPDGKLAYELPTKHKQVAKFMMTEFVGKLRLKDGRELTCATCHAGRSEFLPHRFGTAGAAPPPEGKGP